MQYFYTHIPTTFNHVFDQLECALKAAKNDEQITTALKGFIRYRYPEAVFEPIDAWSDAAAYSDDDDCTYKPRTDEAEKIDLLDHYCYLEELHPYMDFPNLSWSMDLCTIKKALNDKEHILKEHYLRRYNDLTTSMPDEHYPVLSMDQHLSEIMVVFNEQYKRVKGEYP